MGSLSEEKPCRRGASRVCRTVPSASAACIATSGGTAQRVRAPCGERLRDGLPGSVVLVIDAAYAEFVDDPAFDDGLALVGDRDNVVVTRTFSKAFGLAALRVGWIYGTAEMIG
ncbi:MAG: aminotransferase class I/II-fold pyridoxal phosphate-dependent enzyme, partial [Geminicoccaceae bacterium]|nr:aminotransferase class I/II-fold pyridoxal phosphate-dependent enzyme [Geminicoccaceae bacterium]